MPVPIRTCVGCRRSRPAAELVRVVSAGDGRLAIGRTLGGRGAWLCRDDTRCVDKAVRRRAFGRALRVPVAPAAVEWLQEELAKRARMEDCGPKRP